MQALCGTTKRFTRFIWHARICVWIAGPAFIRGAWNRLIWKWNQLSTGKITGTVNYSIIIINLQSSFSFFDLFGQIRTKRMSEHDCKQFLRLRGLRDKWKWFPVPEEEIQIFRYPVALSCRISERRLYVPNRQSHRRRFRTQQRPRRTHILFHSRPYSII